MEAVNGGSARERRVSLLYSKSCDFERRLLRQLAILTDDMKLNQHE